MKGYVYVLTNDAMPGLVKIGRSKHAAGVRAGSLYKGDTGVPLPFDVHFECLFDDCVEAEALVHEYLDEHRINPNREFFRVDPEDAAIWVIRTRAEENNYRVEISEIVVDPAYIYSLSETMDAHPFIIASALEDLTPEEVRPVLDRRLEKIERRKEQLTTPLKGVK